MSPDPPYILEILRDLSGLRNTVSAPAHTPTDITCVDLIEIADIWLYVSRKFNLNCVFPFIFLDFCCLRVCCIVPHSVDLSRIFRCHLYAGYGERAAAAKTTV